MAKHQSQRTYAGELEWALDRIRFSFCSEPMRTVEVLTALRFAENVAFARRSHYPIPARPNLAAVATTEAR